MTTEAKERLYLLDGMALAYRAYFSFIGRPLINSKGINTGAIYGFTTALLKILDEQPDHIAVVFDTPEPTFRHHLYKEYKATRQKMPEDMASQLGAIRDVVRAFNTPLIELPGYEADDVMGTLARRAEREGVMTYLVTGDKDFMQLISPLIRMYRPGKAATDAEIVDASGVQEKFGVTPDRVIDVLGLIGDTSDNVPGVPGVGEKTAIPLIQQYGTMENLYAHLADIPQKGVRAKLEANRELAFLSKRLVTIDTAAPVAIDFHQLRATPRDTARLRELFTTFEFKTLVSRLGAPAPASPSPAPEQGTTPPAAELPAGDITTDRHVYHLVQDAASLKALCARLRTADLIVVDTETTSTDALRAHLVGIAIAWEEREAYYIPVRTAAARDGETGGLFGDDVNADTFRVGNLATALDVKTVAAALAPILGDERIKKAGQNIKYDMLVLGRHGMPVEGVAFDTMVGSYILRADGQHNLDALALGAFNYRMVSYEDLVGKGKNAKHITDVDLKSLADYSAEDADLTLRLLHVQKPELERLDLLKLCQEIEFPLISVLARVEERGVSLDTEHLAGMSKELERLMENLTIEIHRDAGGAFNINSTQQLGEILFHRLGLPTQKKTKTGFSTDVNVLESLRGLHPIVERLLEFRQLTKLKSTYVDALPSLINPVTHRVHTSFNQTVAATGRLSSSDPNLQNIPIRTEAGRAIRKAFIPAPGTLMVSADYSQIELRIMAHISGDEGLIEAFTRREDIHASTAAKVFGVAAGDVSRDMRRKAKEVNFGIMYGIGAFGLKTRLGISQGEAQQIIDRYFERFPRVRQYIQDTIASARARGYVATLLGRRRYFPDIASRNQAVRSNAERAAINMPIQGTAADMIKVAMIRIDTALRREKLRSAMILQVHDELVFEVPEKEREIVEPLIRAHMVDALKLQVPVEVEIGAGRNWLEAH